MKKITQIFATILLLLLSQWSVSQVRVPKIDIEDFTGTEEQAMEKMAALQALITEAENEGFDALKEKMAISLAEVFLLYAKSDEDNKSSLVSMFDGLHTFHETTPEKLAEHLATYERSAVITVLDESIAALTGIINGDIVRQSTPDVDWSQITYDGNQMIFDGKPVFLTDYSGKQGSAGPYDLTKFFGSYGGDYVDPKHVSNENGDIVPWLRNDLTTKPSGNFGTFFFGHRRTPDWLLQKYPDIETGRAYYTAYDISSPGAREVVQKLCAGIVPLTKGKNYTKQGYMLTNEPHWNLSGTWQVVQFSEHAKDSLRNWLKNKHTDVANLNTLWGKSFASFDDVEIDDFPMPTSERGKPIWYDIMKFNQDRITDWFKFFNDQVLKHDPEAKTHLKLIPGMWSGNGRHNGLDFEALTDMTTNIGNDAGAKNSLRWGAPQPWQERYHYSWSDMAMSYDFFRSVSPNKVNYNSESHFIQAGGFTDLFLDPSYVRSIYWQSVLQGMNSNKTWYWPRNTEGGYNNTEFAVAGSIVQQPRAVFELHETFMDLNAHSEHIAALQHIKQHIRLFYSETSAINKSDHMSSLFELYESLYFEGQSIGFATEKIIKNHLNSNWDVIVVSKTEYVTEAELDALQLYLDNGGTVIIDAVSLKKDEYGRNLNKSLNTNSGGVLLSASSVEDFTAKALNLINDKGHSPTFTLAEINGIGEKGCVWRSYVSDEGENIINIINIGKTEATLDLKLSGNSSALVCTNLLNGEKLDGNFTMQPETVYLFSVRERTVEDNRFIITTTGETCPDQSNGTINIVADIEQDYVVTFNGADSSFTKEITLENIVPGTYELCIAADGSNVSKCYNLEIKGATSVSGKSQVDVKSKTMTVEVEEGTAPYTVLINNAVTYQTSATSFNIEVNQGDEVMVKTDKDCEGLMTKRVDFLDNILAYPNPTSGIIEINIPVSVDTVPVNIYSLQSQIISSEVYPVNSGKVNLNLEGKPDGIYFVELLLERPVNIKIVKQ